MPETIFSFFFFFLIVIFRSEEKVLKAFPLIWLDLYFSAYVYQVEGVNSDVSEVTDAMVKTFQSNVEMLLDRMQRISGQGKHIAMDATAQVLLSTPHVEN